eukprot:443393_1
MKAKVGIRGEYSKPFSIERGVAQGCKQSSSSFNAAFASIKVPESGRGQRPQNAQPSSAVRVPYLKPPSQNSLLVSKRQRGNPILKHIRNVKWEHSSIIPDFIMGKQTCALFLSLRYHKLHPKYIYGRIEQIKKAFRLRILLCFVDVDDNVGVIEEITQIAFINDWTLICAWSSAEAGRYIETFHCYERKPADLIMQKVESKQEAKFSDVLTEIRSVNKTDVVTLAANFGSFAQLMQATKTELSSCPGLGPVKVNRIFDAFHKPFRNISKSVSSSSNTISSAASSSSSISSTAHPSSSISAAAPASSSISSAAPPSSSISSAVLSSSSVLSAAPSSSSVSSVATSSSSISSTTPSSSFTSSAAPSSSSISSSSALSSSSISSTAPTSSSISPAALKDPAVSSIKSISSTGVNVHSTSPKCASISTNPDDVSVVNQRFSHAKEITNVSSNEVSSSIISDQKTVLSDEKALSKQKKDGFSVLMKSSLRRSKRKKK